MEIGETTETDRETGAEVAATIDLQEKCTMSLVRIAEKRPKFLLSLPKAGLFTVQNAFLSIGLQRENSNHSIPKWEFRKEISLPYAFYRWSFLLERLQETPLRELLLSHWDATVGRGRRTDCPIGLWRKVLCRKITRLQGAKEQQSRQVCVSWWDKMHNLWEQTKGLQALSNHL